MDTYRKSFDAKPNESTFDALMRFMDENFDIPPIEPAPEPPKRRQRMPGGPRGVIEVSLHLAKKRLRPWHE